MTERADLVVVGAGTVGGWASVFAAVDGIGRVIVLEQGLVGMGASSRAARLLRRRAVRLAFFFDTSETCY